MPGRVSVPIQVMVGSGVTSARLRLLAQYSAALELLRSVGPAAPATVLTPMPLLPTVTRPLERVSLMVGRKSPERTVTVPSACAEGTRARDEPSTAVIAAPARSFFFTYDLLV